jgi:hypothetical protein
MKLASSAESATDNAVSRHNLDPTYFFGRAIYSDTPTRLNWENVYELGCRVLGLNWRTKTELSVGLQTTLALVQKLFSNPMELYTQTLNGETVVADCIVVNGVHSGTSGSGAEDDEMMEDETTEHASGTYSIFLFTFLLILFVSVQTV